MIFSLAICFIIASLCRLNKKSVTVYSDEVDQMNELASPRGKRALPIISVITFVGFLDTHLLIPIMSLYASDLGASVGTVGLIIGLYSIVNTPANILFGRLVDRFGYKLLLVVGLLGDAAGMFLYSLSRLPVHLILVRILHGITGGIVGPATMSAASYLGGESRQSRTMAYYGMSLATATLVGYGLSGALASRAGYDVVFYLGAGLLVVGTFLSLSLPDKRYHRNDNQPGNGSEARGQIGTLLRRKGLVSPYCTVFAQYFTFGSVVTLLPLYVKDLGMDALHVGMMLAGFAVMFIIVQLPVSKLSDRFGRLRLSIAGLVLGIISLVILPSAEALAWLVVLMLAYGAAFGAIFPSISAMVAEHTSPGERGMATGIFHALLTAGVAVGALVAGYAGDALGIKYGLLLSPVFMVIALAVALVIMKRS
jgi:MFS family permease